MEKPKALVLLSGGVDSTTLLYYVKKVLKYTDVAALIFDYGQKHKKEIEYAKKNAEKLKVKYKVRKIDVFTEDSHPLKNGLIPNSKEDKQYKTVVPARNLLFISYAVREAMLEGCQDVFIASCMNDFKSYPDCRKEFIESLCKATSLAYGVRIYAPFAEMEKKKIVEIGRKLGVDFDETWSCYKGLDKPCGKCNACAERLEALRED